mgnify:CR=1 FL=1
MIRWFATSNATPTIADIIRSASVAGTTPVLNDLMEITNGYVDGQHSYVLSFATGGTYGLPISTGSGAPSLNFSSAVVVNITGVTSTRGGERLASPEIPLNGVGMMLGGGRCNLYIRVVRDSTSANDVGKANGAISMGFMAARFRQ